MTSRFRTWWLPVCDSGKLSVASCGNSPCWRSPGTNPCACSFTALAASIGARGFCALGSLSLTSVPRWKPCSCCFKKDQRWRNRPYVLEALWRLEGLRAEWQRDFSATQRLIHAAGRPSRLFGTKLRCHRSNDGIRGCHKKGRDVNMCLLHLRVKRCAVGTRESLVMIVTSFALRSQSWWQLQCEMYVLQLYVVLAQLRLTLRCRCADASPSTSPHLSTITSSHARIPRSTSPPHHTHTSAHLYHICTSTLSLLDFCPVFLSFFLSTYPSLAFVHLHLRTLTSMNLPPTSIHLQIYIAPAHPHRHSFTSTLSFSLSIHRVSHLHSIFDSAGQSHVSLSGHPSSSY